MDSQTRMHRIRETIRDIPRGCVASYGQIAEIAGIPRGARQVGYTLRHLPQAHSVPWHRVVQFSGKIAFDRGSPQFEELANRLMIEDVAVSAGRIDLLTYRWQPKLDELLWKPPSAWDES